MTAPGVTRSTPFSSLLGAAHYWHGRWYRLRYWRAVALASLLANLAAAGRIGGWW